MQTIIRLITSVLLTSVVSVLCFAQSVENLYDFEYSGLYYKIVSDGEVVISPVSKTEIEGMISFQGINGITDLRVDASVVYNDSFYTVVGVADHAFENSTDLRTVKFDYMTTIENPISIGESAFENCNNLESVTITKGIKQIGMRAFFGCDRLNKIALGPDNHQYGEYNNLTVKQDAFASTPNLQYIFLTHANPASYTIENCFEGNTQDMTVYIPNRNFDNIETFSTFHKILYGNFDKCNVPFTGEIPQITPVFKSNMPADFTMNQPYFESNERNVGSYSSSVWISFVSGYPDYMLFSVSIPFEYTITPAPLIISTGNYERAYGEPNPEITINVTGFLNGDNENVFSTKPMIVNGIADWAPTLPGKTSEVGVYEIFVMAALPWGSNYECQYERGIITVIPANQTITWDPESQDFNVGEMIALNAVSSSGLPVEYCSSDSKIAKIENGNLLFLEEGRVTVTASQSGNKNYIASEPVSHTFIVNAATDKGLTLNISSAELKIQDQLQLIISDFEWSSSDERVAKVSETGLVTAVDAGTAMITLTRKNDGATLSVCRIRVDKLSSVSELSLKKGIQINCEGNELRIEGASPSSIVNIFDIKGQIIYSGTERIIPLKQGIYLVSVEDNRFKIIIR